VPFGEIHIEKDPVSEDLVIPVNHGKRTVPQLKIGERYIARSPFRAQQLAKELNIPVNPQGYRLWLDRQASRIRLGHLQTVVQQHDIRIRVGA